MNKSIPIYELNTLFDNEENSRDIFFLSKNTERSKTNIHIPYRSNYYKIGICLKGNAHLKANVETYDIKPNSLMLMSPYIIKQWSSFSEDFQALSIFFTEAFISTNNNLSLDKFSFFESFAKHSFEISMEESENISNSLRILEKKYETPHLYKNEILKSHLTSLLYEIAAIYDQHNILSKAVQTRSQQLSTDFKKLMLHHASKERALKFYAEKLFVSPKHLTETVKAVTGKTAGEWITESVILEAKILLQNPVYNIAQISELLHFSDQATFSKFFKNSVALSPLAYKQAV